jgi:hypothetical protein
MIARVNWVKLVDPTTEESARYGSAVFARCERCGGREVFPLPADIPDVIAGLTAILAAHRACAVPLTRSADNKLRAALGKREFYDLMQAYRTAPIVPFSEAGERFEAVKSYLVRELEGEAPPAGGEL